MHPLISATLICGFTFINFTASSFAKPWVEWNNQLKFSTHIDIGSIAKHNNSVYAIAARFCEGEDKHIDDPCNTWTVSAKCDIGELSIRDRTFYKKNRKEWWTEEEIENNDHFISYQDHSKVSFEERVDHTLVTFLNQLKIESDAERQSLYAFLCGSG